MTEPEATPAFSCADFEQVAEELALGVLGGIDRSSALAHLERCPRCRLEVEGALRVGDLLLELGPEAEPPVGFESRALARREVELARRPRRSPRGWAALGAGVGAALTAAGLFFGLGLSSGSRLQVHQPTTFAALGARQISAAALLSGGQEVGQVFILAGKPSWVFMTVSMAGPARRVTCELVTTSGRHLDLGSFTVSGGYWSSWGATVSFDPATIHSVRLVATNGRTLSQAKV